MQLYFTWELSPGFRLSYWKVNRKESGIFKDNVYQSEVCWLGLLRFRHVSCIRNIAWLSWSWCSLSSLGCFGSGVDSGRFAGAKLSVDVEKDDDADVDETHDEDSFGGYLESAAFFWEVSDSGLTFLGGWHFVNYYKHVQIGSQIHSIMLNNLISAFVRDHYLRLPVPKKLSNCLGLDFWISLCSITQLWSLSKKRKMERRFLGCFFRRWLKMLYSAHLISLSPSRS